jgi:hypothetical protein
VVGCAPTTAGPRGRARCRNASGFAMLGDDAVAKLNGLGMKVASDLPRLYRRGKDWVKLLNCRSNVRGQGLKPKFCAARNFALAIVIRLDQNFW